MRRPAMLIVAACFGVSALARLTGPGVALALDAEIGDAAPAIPGVEAEDLPLLLAKIREREAQLDARAQRLAEKSKLIEAAETKLRDQLKVLEEAEARFSRMVDVADGAADRDVEKLIAAYQSMDPKRAAAIFETMEPDFAAGLLGRMSTEAAAGILAALPPAAAYAATVRIATRNAGGPKE